MGNYTILQMFENPRRGRQARNFTTNAPKILDLKSSSEQIFPRKLPLGAPELRVSSQNISGNSPVVQCCSLDSVVFSTVSRLSCSDLEITLHGLSVSWISWPRVDQLNSKQGKTLTKDIKALRANPKEKSISPSLFLTLNL